MKTLILTRHAKSDWSNRLQKDYDRELNERGMRDAPIMGARFAERGIRINQIISSSSKRTQQTAKLLSEAIHFPSESILWLDRLYHASPPTIQEVILECDDQYQSILLVGHNNGITDFANSLIGVITDNMPTCSMIGFEIDTMSWSEFSLAKKTLLFFDYPKHIEG